SGASASASASQVFEVRPSTSQPLASGSASGSSAARLNRVASGSAPSSTPPPPSSTPPAPFSTGSSGTGSASCGSSVSVLSFVSVASAPAPFAPFEGAVATADAGGASIHGS